MTWSREPAESTAGVRACPQTRRARRLDGTSRLATRRRSHRGVGVGALAVWALALFPGGPAWSAEQASPDDIDAFVTVVVRASGAPPTPRTVQLGLSALLIDTRLEIIEGSSASKAGSNFEALRDHLVPLVEEAAKAHPAPAQTRLETLAADVARTNAPSREDLRSLLSGVAPRAGDPLARSWEVDDGLRAVFGFGPVRSGQHTERLGSWTSVRPASLFAPVRDLDEWVPAANHASAYVSRVKDVLQHTLQDTLEGSSLDAQQRDLFREMVFATAWQESCWRQFEVRHKKIEPLRSRAGALGIMQINPYVWRGLYDVDDLRWKIEYNAHAGGEILLHYMVDHAIPRGHGATAGARDDLAKAAYAAYNAGPRKMSRYDRGTRIDRAFWTKFESVRAGTEIHGIKSCLFGAAAAREASRSRAAPSRTDYSHWHASKSALSITQRSDPPQISTSSTMHSSSSSSTSFTSYSPQGTPVSMKDSPVSIVSSSS